MRVKANFVKLNPSGNTTALILNSFPREDHPRIASEVMKTASLCVEQAGFLERPSLPDAAARLQMMGGEFCGNASRGFAAWLVHRRFPGIATNDAGQFVVPFEASGHTGILTATVNPNNPEGRYDEAQYYVDLPMPLPKWIRQMNARKDGRPYTLVEFEGIVHAVAWDITPSEEQFEIIKADVHQELRGVWEKVDCLGVMFYDERTQFLTPLVEVEKTGSRVWENSCGSGSAALAAALAERDRKDVNSMRLTQPGGAIDVAVTWKGRVEEIKIGGNVSIEAEGVVYFDADR